MLRTVAEILTRFRLFPIGLTSDIEKAFLMISINEADRDSLRFLWYENVQAEEGNLQLYRFCRVVFGVTCSPFLLNANLSRYIRKYQDEHPIICTKLFGALYADDVTSGGYSVEDVYQLFLQSKQIMSDGDAMVVYTLENGNAIRTKLCRKSRKLRIKVRITLLASK